MSVLLVGISSRLLHSSRNPLPKSNPETCVSDAKTNISHRFRIEKRNIRAVETSNNSSGRIESFKSVHGALMPGSSHAFEEEGSSSVGGSLSVM